MGEPEWFDLEAFDDAIYPLRTFADQYDAAQDDEDVALDEVLLGGNAYDYASQFDDDVIEFIVELPYFFDPQIQDQTELDRTREDVIQEGIQSQQPLLEAMQNAVESVGEYLPDTSMAREAAGVASYFEDEYESKLE